MVQTKLKQERSRKTRAEIITAARKEFARWGVANTSVDRIVRIARVSKGAFYFHFDSKAEAVEEVERTILSEDPSLSELELFTRIQTEPNIRLLVDIILNGRS